MAGDGLLLDVDAIEAYVEEIVAPPQRAPRDPDAAARGLVIFESPAAGCSGCHAGPDFTDNTLHEVLAPLDPDDILPASNTPGLRGVFLRRPYFHDGRAPDLRDALTRADAASHGGAAGLTPGDLDDLLAYLEAL
jgi:cytochrome c peroxidase